MKKVVIVLLFAILLTGCSSHNKVDNGEIVIDKIINYSISEGGTNREDELKKEVGSYFTKEGIQKLISSKMGLLYIDYFESNKLDKIEELKIKRSEKEEIGQGSKLVYEVSYVVMLDNKKEKRKDTIELKVNEDDKVEEFIIINTSDLIDSLFFNNKVN